MKGLLGFGFFLLFLAGIALVTLKGREIGQIGASGSGAEITGIRWRPVVVGDDAMPDDSGMFIQFEVDGSIKGHGGCNGFFGSLQQTESGIGVGALIATEKACPRRVMSREKTFLSAVQETTNFESGSDSMRLLDKDDEVLADFVNDAGE